MRLELTGRRAWLGLYGGSLALSWVSQRLTGLPDLPRGMRAASISDGIRIAYRDSAPESDSPPVLLIHGSPGDSDVFTGLTALLTPRFRVIAVDLPGFGFSTRELRDYSFRAHGRYVIELLDALHIPRAQLVGFSMGGGVALSAYDVAPERVASIVMLSAIGAQEYELLGGYWRNHLLHGLQLWGLRVLRAGLPHFGLLDSFPLNIYYARNFYDSDQRPLRSILTRYKGPMLILHGADDPMAPVAAAREHHRLVPQSELQIIEGNHFLVFQRPWTIAGPLTEFLARVARGSSVLRTRRLERG